MKALLDNVEEFLASGEDNLKNKRYNAAVSDFFKAIVILADYLIYRDIKIIPKNHNERFSLLSKYFHEIYAKVSNLFKIYIRSYNLRLGEVEAKELKEFAYGFKNKIINKK